MSRLADTLQSGPMTDGITAPMLNLAYGGQHGYAPNLSQYINSASYVRRNLIALLMEAPRGFAYFPDPAGAVATLKNLIETHPKSIDGLRRDLSAQFTDIAVGGAGELQEDLTKVTRERSQPSFSYVEKAGRPIQTFFEEWILMLGMDPDSGVPGVSTLLGARPTDLLPDMTTATVLFIEPDPTHQFVMKAWLVTNMFPRGTGEISGKRDLTAQMDVNEFSIEFTGIASSNLGVRAFAQALLSQINLANANPYLAPAFIEGVEADVAAAAVGYQVGAEALGASAVISRG